MAKKWKPSSDAVWHFMWGSTVCSGLSVQILRVNMVKCYVHVVFFFLITGMLEFNLFGIPYVSNMVVFNNVLRSFSVYKHIHFSNFGIMLN